MNSRSTCLGRTPSGHRVIPAERRSLAAAPVALLGVDRIDFAFEVLEVLEALVHASEPDVRDLVDRAQLLHGQRSNPGRWHLRRAGCPQLGLDLVGGLLGGAVRNGTTRQRLAQPGRELRTVELLAGAVALDDNQARRLDALVGREPHRARRALAAAADRGRVVEVARVDDAGVPRPALGAAHRTPAELIPLGVVVYREDTTRWCGSRRRPEPR